MSRYRWSWHRRIATLGALGLGVAILVDPTGAGTRRHDRLDALHLDLAVQPQFEALGQLLGEGTCNATLIAPRWIVTVAHCVDNATIPIENRSFVIGSQSYSIAAITLHPDWAGNSTDGTDIAVLELAQPVTGVTPANRYTGASELGAEVVMVGYGREGDGITGEIAGTDGTRRAGENTLDVLGSAFGIDDRIIFSDFDEPLAPSTSLTGDTSPLDLEYQLARLDSGAGVFKWEAGQWHLVSIGSLIGDTSGDGIDSNYGDVSGSIRITTHNEWIDFVLCPADSNGDQNVDIQDLLAIIADWGPCPAPCPSDSNLDDTIDILDLLRVISDWGTCPN